MVEFRHWLSNSITTPRHERKLSATEHVDTLLGSDRPKGSSGFLCFGSDSTLNTMQSMRMCENGIRIWIISREYRWQLSKAGY